MKQTMNTGALICAIMLSPASVAESFPLPTEMNEIVVTAARMPQPLRQVIGDTTVINEQEIHQSGAADVATILRTLVGIEVIQTGGLGSQSSIFMRGANSNQVLVLVDGVRINSATTGTTALEHIMLDSIERIEVVRGNVSSLYGSEAIGGVIQLFTKQGRLDPTLHASVVVGGHGTQRLSGSYSGTIDANSFSVNVGMVNTQGVSAINPNIVPSVNPANNGYENTTFSTQLKHTFNLDHQLSVSLFSTTGDSQYDSIWGVPTDQYHTQAAIEKLSLTSDDQLSALWHSKSQLSRGTDTSNDIANGIQMSRFNTANSQFSWQNVLQLSDHQRVNFTAEHLSQAVTSDTIFDQVRRTNTSVLAGYAGDYGHQQIQFNLRQDRYSDFGRANTGLIGYGVSISEVWRATASISNAFKAPTFNDLYYPGFANPNLSPEHSINKEVGLHYAQKGQQVDAIYFNNRINNLIVSTAATGYIPANVNQAKISGQELSYGGDISNTHLKFGITSQNPRDMSTGTVLTKRAKTFGTIAARHDYDKWNTGAELRFSGSRQDGAQTLPRYQLLNLSTGYNLNRHWNIQARVDNLFNRNYSEAYSYNTLGRTLYVALHYQ